MTLIHPKVHPVEVNGLDVEALIREARRLRRRRWTLGAVALLLIGVGVVLGVVLSAGTPATGRQSKTAPGTFQSSSPAAGVLPKAPDALAVASNRDLYFVDSGRDQILRRLANGKFEVVAGTGTRGFSGDGGRAVEAKLDLGRFGTTAGIAVAPNGTVYFSDSGNDRVRAVLENGDIETVAGGGTRALPKRPGEQVPARTASLGSPAGLTFGPDGELYIAANFIVRLTPAGQLAWEAGTNQSEPPACNATTCLLQEQNFNNAGGLAFDGDGDLVVTSSDFPGAGFGIAEIRSNGKLVDLGACRGEGGMAGALSSAPNGSAICAAQTGLFRIPDGSESQTLIPASEALSSALGSGPWPFLGGDGIAVGSNGDIYVDTSPNASATPYAILELAPSGSARVLWKS